MKTTLAKLDAHIAKMSREELETLARDVVCSLYADVFVMEDEDITLAEIESLGLSESGQVYINSEKEWTGDTLGNVAEDVENAGLNPERYS